MRWGNRAWERTIRLAAAAILPYNIITNEKEASWAGQDRVVEKKGRRKERNDVQGSLHK